ncbi:MAG: DNA polymerase IV [Clostridia bacterium]|nr:DNA polymerase IV [Clostridia bacterium]
MERQILHVDVNNAFLSWTAIDRLRLGETLDIRTIPAIIGGDESSRHGIVLAKSMKAKEFGIKTGEPILWARKKCPNLQVFQGDYSSYKKHSDELYQLLLEYTDKIERFSIDECFMDMTLFLRPNEKLIDKAYEINKRVKEELGFTVNIGVAPNKLLAKMASDFKKPDRVHTLYKEEIPKKMWVLPISELFMVGRKSIPKLEQMGIKTIGDMAKQDEKILIKRFGKHGKMMWEYANGIDESEVIYKYEQPKNIGNSITLPQDVYNINRLNEILLALSEQVAFRLRKYGLKASVVSVQIKTKDFVSYSHQKKLNTPTNITKEIYETSKELLEQLHQNRGVRLIGIQTSKLVEKDQIQLSIFEQQTDKKQEKIENVMDDLKKKYGYEVITRAGEMKVSSMLNIRDEKKE